MNLYNHKIEVSCDTCGEKIAEFSIHIDSKMVTTIVVSPHQCSIDEDLEEEN